MLAIIEKIKLLEAGLTTVWNVIHRNLILEYGTQVSHSNGIRDYIIAVDYAPNSQPQAGVVYLQRFQFFADHHATYKNN